jgi:hypothetical protein
VAVSLADQTVAWGHSQGLIGQGEARSVLYAVRAAKQLDGVGVAVRLDDERGEDGTGHASAYQA